MSTRETDVRAVATASASLAVIAREDRWCHLSLCVIDAVFSIGARYGSTWRAARRYANYAGLEPATAPAVDVAAGRFMAEEEPLSEFLTHIRPLTDDEFALVLGNRQLTSSRHGIPKASACRQYAEHLVENGLETLTDIATLMTNPERLDRVEGDLTSVRGHGSGVRVAYLWMLAGDDRHVKADRMVTRWLGQVLGRVVGVAEAGDLISRAADEIHATPWELDHAIWKTQRGGR